MKKTAFILLIPILLSACAEPTQPTVERQQLKDNCLAADFTSCADLGHIVHQERLKAGPPDGYNPGLAAS